MSYGYFQGQEAQALAFYKRLLETEMNADARKNLATLIEKLQKVVDQRQPQGPGSKHSLQNSPQVAWLCAA